MTRQAGAFFGRSIAVLWVALTGAAPGAAATLGVDLQLTASAAIRAGVVPGKAYRMVYTGAVSGSLTGEFVHAISIEPESVWWPAAEVPWSTLLLTTPRGTLTLSLTSARLNRGEATETAPWSGGATWVVAGGTGSFSGATGRGTLAITAGTNPAAATNAMTETLAGTLTLDGTAPVIQTDIGSTRTPLRGPNGRLAVEIDLSDAILSSGLRLVEIQGKNAAVVSVNNERVGDSALPYRQEFLEGTAIRRWTVVVEATSIFPPAVQVSLSDWAGNTATK
jgi:hypothetical protein